MLKISQCDYAIARSSLVKYSVRQTKITAVNLVWLRTLGIQKVQHTSPRNVG